MASSCLMDFVVIHAANSSKCFSVHATQAPLHLAALWEGVMGKNQQHVKQDLKCFVRFKGVVLLVLVFRGQIHTYKKGEGV